MTLIANVRSKLKPLKPLKPRSVGFIFLSVALSGCILTRGQSLKAEAAPTQPPPQAQQAKEAQQSQQAKGEKTSVTAKRQETTPSPWHDLLVAKLSNEPGQYKDAWALFSSGGWADAGQILVLGDKGSKRYHVYLIKPGESEISSDHPVRAEDFDKVLAPAIKAASELHDLAPLAFDALTFYYEHASVGGDGKVVIAKRLLIRPTVKTPSPRHDAVVAAFQKIR